MEFLIYLLSSMTNPLLFLLFFGIIGLAISGNKDQVIEARKEFEKHPYTSRVNTLMTYNHFY